MWIIRVLALYILLALHIAAAAENSTDPNGYVIFCPCMGK